MSKSNIPQKAQAVAALEAGLSSVDKIAKAANVSRATIYNWQREAKQGGPLEEAVQMKKAALADKMETLAAGIADKLLNQLDLVSFDNKAPAVMASSIDKWLTLTGQASSITESRVSGSIDLTIEARRAVQLYVSEGFTPAEAVASLQDDDPELYRAYLSDSHGGPA
jgi:hypothetical protein